MSSQATSIQSIASDILESIPSGVDAEHDETDSKSTAKATTEALRLEKTIEKLSQGFTRIPNSILMEIIAGDLSKTEIKFLLLVGRFTIHQDLKDHAEISKRNAMRLLRAQGKAILSCIGSLVERELIFKLGGNYVAKNRFGLVYDKSIFDKSKKTNDPEDSEAPKNETAPVENSPPLEKEISEAERDQKRTNPWGKKGTHPQAPKRPHKKDSLSNELLSKAFSNFSSESNAVKNYIENLPTIGKREAEAEHLVKLLESHSMASIALGLEDVQKNGTLAGKPCHSPLAYLAVALGDVLAMRHQRTFAAEKRKESQKAQQALAQANQEAQARLDQVQDLKREAFFQAFQTAEARHDYIAKLMRSNPRLKPDSPLTLGIAINAYAQESGNCLTS